MFINLLVAPVKNPPVATNTTKPRSLATFLSFVSLSFWVQLGFHCPRQLIGGLHRVICGVPPTICGAPKVICGTPKIICGRPPVICGVPKVSCGVPQVICGVPQMTRWSPPMTRREGYLPFLTRFIANLTLLFNKYPLFHTQNFQLWLIS